MPGDMESLVDIVMFHARTPTLLPFACASTLRVFREYPESRRTLYAREYLAARYSGWDVFRVVGRLGNIPPRDLREQPLTDVLSDR